MKHGTWNGYNRHHCRCGDCRAANARHQRLYGYDVANRRARFAERIDIDGQLVHPSPYGGHGSLSAYNNCGCRCDPCRQAKRDRLREYRARASTYRSPAT